MRISDWSSDVCSSDLQIVRNGGRAFALPLDLADEDSVRGFYEQVLEHCGRVDILHNNEADTRAEQLGKDMAVAAMSPDIWDRAFTIKPPGTMLMTKYSIAPIRSDELRVGTEVAVRVVHGGPRNSK